MSDLLFNWLNDEVQLSRRISNFQQDFHNGYLFGQLLSKYSQQLNFNQFVDKDDKGSRIANFSLLYDTFRTLRVSYDSNIAMAIIEKKTGIAKKLLYELKMQLEKTTSNAFTKLNKPTKPLSPLKKIPLSKDKFDKISKQHFTKQLNEMHRAQKNINIDAHLRKFPEFQQKQLVKAEVEENREYQARLFGQRKFRDKQLENIKKSADFRMEWEQSNLEKWNANMTIRKLQNQKDQAYKTKLENSKMQSKTMSELSAIKNLDDDIKSFEKKIKLQKNLPKDSSSESEQEKAPNVPKEQNISFLKKKSIKEFPKKSADSNFFAQTNKSALSEQQELDLRKKKSPKETQLNRHQREKKRRKMIVEQSKKQQIIKIQRRQKYMISTLEQNSKQEKQIEYEIWRAMKNKDVIVENKAAREQKKQEKEETRIINAKFKDDELTKTYREEHNKIELKEACQRQQKLRINNSVKQRKQVYNECRGFVEKFVDMMEVLYQHGQQSNKEELDDNFVNHLLDQFVSDANTDKEVADLELKNYITGRGQWKVQITRDSQEQPSDPVQDNALPETIINNYYLGNILKTVFTQIYETQPQIKPQKSNCSYLATIMGLEFAGKTLIADKISAQMGFHVIHIHKLIEDTMKKSIEMQQRGIELDTDSSEIKKLCLEGKQIPNKLILSILKEEVNKHERCLVVNYPTTYEESIEMTEKFGCVKPADAIQKGKLTTKIQQFSRLVWPTQSKTISRSLKPCGVDFALWVQVQPKSSLDRFLGRRWTPDGKCLHINEEISNPNDLMVGEKASSTILRNNFKIKNRNKIENWLRSFGIKVIDNEEEKVQLCWETISGEQSPEIVIQNALEAFEKALSIKQKRILEIKLEEEACEKQKKQKIEQQQIEKQLKEKCAKSNPEQIQKKYQEALSSMKMSETFLANIQRLWNSTEKITVNAFLSVFQAIREQEQSKNKHISNTKKNFLRLLTREDQRFFLVKNFQNQYNKFYDQNQDMVSQEYTKEELHQRIQDLEVDLLSLIQEKNDDAVSECQNIMKSGWLESQLEQIISCVHVLLQTQLNRSFACQQILADFYSKKYMVQTGEIEESQLTINIDESLEIFKEDSFPRLQKLISEAMRLFNKQEQVADDKNKKGGKPPKKDDKKAAKKGGKEEVEENKEPTAEQIEFKKALNTEKAIFRYRVKVINQFASKRLKQYQQICKKLYEDLEDLYKYTDKVEKQSVNNMTKIFKQAIEEESKIENQVQINYTQVTETELIRNFQKPKPIIQPASEQYQQSRFSITALKEFLRILLKQSESGVVIKTARLLAMFQQFLINQSYRSLMPETWKNLKRENYEHFVLKFDPHCKGEIQLWTMMQIAALSNANLPSNKQLQHYQLSLSDHNPNFKQIKKQKIMKTEAWFDTEEPVFENTRQFRRNEYLKEILYGIHQNGESVGLEKYIKRLKLSEYGGIEQNANSDKTYFDMAFGAINSD